MTKVNGHMPFEWTGRIAPDALSLDDFEVTGPSGAVFVPHVGEVVWCKAYGQTIQRNLETVGVSIDGLQEAMASGKNDDIEAAMLPMAEVICQRAVGWNLTDPYTGDPFPQPSEGPQAVYEALPSALFLWLFSKLAGLEDAVARGNGLVGSQSTSSAKTARNRRPRRKS